MPIRMILIFRKPFNTIIVFAIPAVYFFGLPGIEAIDTFNTKTDLIFISHN